MGKESTKHNGSSAARTIAAVVISTSVLLTGAVYGYATVRVSGTGSTSANVYGVGGPSQLNGALK